MRYALPLVLLVFASGSGAGQTPPPTSGGDEPPGFALWTSARVKEAADRLEQKIGADNIAFETIGNWEGHSVYLVLRAATAEAEFHETESDLYIAQRGRASFIIGGELVDAKSLPRKQKRGPSIRGGITRELRPGDILHVPEAIPHQLVIAPGDRFLYLLFKLDEEPLAGLDPHKLVPTDRPPKP